MKERDLDLKDHVTLDDKTFCVSTVALPIEHVGGWYETMVFKSNGKGITSCAELFMRRCETKEQAEAQHAEVVADLGAGKLELQKEFEAFTNAEGFAEDMTNFMFNMPAILGQIANNKTKK